MPQSDYTVMRLININTHIYPIEQYLYEYAINMISEHSHEALFYIWGCFWQWLSWCHLVIVLRGCAIISCQCISSSPLAYMNGPTTIRPYSSSWLPSRPTKFTITVTTTLQASICFDGTLNANDSLYTGSHVPHSDSVRFVLWTFSPCFSCTLT